MIDVTQLTDSQLRQLIELDQQEAKIRLQASKVTELEYKEMIIQDQLNNLVPLWLEYMNRHAEEPGKPVEKVEEVKKEQSRLDYILERKQNKQIKP